jgi:hypothetical protein
MAQLPSEALQVIEHAHQWAAEKGRVFDFDSFLNGFLFGARFGTTITIDQFREFIGYEPGGNSNEGETIN